MPTDKDHWYIPKDEYIGTYRAIKHRMTRETCLSGRYGEIWLSGDDRFKMVLYFAQVSTFQGKLKRHAYRFGDSVVELPLDRLDECVKLIKLSKTMPAQVRYANGQR